MVYACADAGGVEVGRWQSEGLPRPGWVSLRCDGRIWHPRRDADGRFTGLESAYYEDEVGVIHIRERGQREGM